MSPSRALDVAVLGLFAALIAAPRGAVSASEDAVAVLPAAGTDSVDIYSLTGTPNNLQAEHTGQRRLVADSLGPSSFTDLKLLPGGGHLVADFDDRGFATTDADGRLDFALAGRGDRPGVESVSVVGYDDTTSPVRFLYTDDGEQRIAIHDARAEADLWSHRLTSPTVPAELIQVIALPDRRVALAMNWPTLQASGVDVLDLSADRAGEPEVRFANKSHQGAPESTTIVEGMTDLRDVFGLDDDRVLITGARQLFVVSISEHELLARVSLTDRPNLAGEFVAARGLPSGHVAAATVEPGLWTRPHDNHRVVWFDENLESLVARTDPLSRAPWRVEPAGGHGASGTRGLEPDSSFVPTAGLDDLSVQGAIEIRPVPARQGGTGTTRVGLANRSSRPVHLARAAITAAPGSCGDADDGETFAETADLVLSPSESKTVTGAFALDPDAETGPWCLRLQLESREGETRTETRDGAFSVVAEGGDTGRGTGREVESIDLGLRTGDIGLGDDGGSGPLPDLPTDQGGCNCTSPSGGTPPAGGFGLLAWGLLGALLARRR